MAKNTVRKYLENFAEPESKNLSWLNTTFEHQLVIPIFDESLESIKNITEKNYQAGNILFILVFNSPIACSKTAQLLQQQIPNLSDAAENTRHVLKKISTQFPIIDSSENLSLLSVPDTNNFCLLINRVDSNDNLGIPYKDGIGLVRKIGNDVALRLWYENKIGNLWMNNTDADVELPSNYFQSKKLENPDIGALINEFKHQNLLGENRKQIYASELYESSLQHYVDGLNWANSPFAYHSVGSTLSINPKYYAQVRGYPKRNAGEDFHLLNKLRKISIVSSSNASPILLSARVSNRVPFGTGQAINKILEAKEDQQLFYAKDCYIYLKHCLAFLNDYLFNAENSSLHIQVRGFIGTLQQPKELDENIFLDSLLHASSVNTLLRLSQEKPSHKRWQEMVIENFDGLQTLKYIHYLEKNHFPSKTSYYAVQD